MRGATAKRASRLRTGLVRRAQAPQRRRLWIFRRTQGPDRSELRGMAELTSYSAAEVTSGRRRHDVLPIAAAVAGAALSGLAVAVVISSGQPGDTNLVALASSSLSPLPSPGASGVRLITSASHAHQ